MRTIPLINDKFSDFIDGRKPVEVYYNIRKKVFSVRQGGRIMCHTERMRLKNVSFHVGERGRERVRETGVKNVHAYAKGYLVERPQAMEATCKIFYNPLKHKNFQSLYFRTKKQIKITSIYRLSCTIVEGQPHLFGRAEYYD